MIEGQLENKHFTTFPKENIKRVHVSMETKRHEATEIILWVIMTHELEKHLNTRNELKGHTNTHTL